MQGIVNGPRRRDERGERDENNDSRDARGDTMEEPMPPRHTDGVGPSSREQEPRRINFGGNNLPTWRSGQLPSRPIASPTATAQNISDLERHTQTAWSSLDRTRKSKDQLYRENKTLRSEVQKLEIDLQKGRKRATEMENETQGLKMRYEEAWNKKFTLAERLYVSMHSLSTLARS